jgi:pimeloyl-ACP methyl ester carboxylesterase
MSRYLFFTITLFACVACTTDVDSPGQTGDGSASQGSIGHCQALANASPPATVVSDTALITERDDLPPFCQVDGVIAERVGFALRMPVHQWNGKFVVAGCGGFCGSLLPDKPGYSNSINEALKLGFAAITTDGGHRAKSWDTDWAMEDPPALDLYAGAWMPLAVATGRFLVQQFYADMPRRTYFSGCSNGGRLALMAAQRYPALFDGIAGGGGIFDLTGNAGVHGLWLLQSTRNADGTAVIDRSKIPALQAAVLQQCDRLDEVVDGVVSRPDLCHPQLGTLQCQPNSEESCLNPGELAAVKRLYQGATVNGEQVYPGINPGSEFLWQQWVTGSDDNAAWGERAATGNLRLTYGIPGSRDFNPHDYQLPEELNNLQRLAPMLNATDPDLSNFERAGGKLFYYHGLADPLILAGRAEQYYQEAVAVHGKDKLDEFARFVMVPGHGHCWEKPGLVADDFDPLMVIDQWVESGQAPDAVIALQKNSEGRTVRSRKLCALPAVARFNGGDKSLADSYECVQP